MFQLKISFTYGQLELIKYQILSQVKLIHFHLVLNCLLLFHKKNNLFRMTSLLTLFTDKLHRQGMFVLCRRKMYCVIFCI